MKLSSVLNTPGMQMVRYHAAPTEPTELDGALTALRIQRARELEMATRQLEAKRQQALLQAARDSEREMIEYLAQEAVTARREDHERALASVNPNDLSDEIHRAIGALPKVSSASTDAEDARKAKSKATDMMVEKSRYQKNQAKTNLRAARRIRRVERKYSSGDWLADLGDARGRELLINEIVGDLFDKESNVRDAALVGYDMPNGDVQESYLEKRRLDGGERKRMAGMLGGAGVAIGGGGGALYRQLTKKGPLKLPLYAAGALGAIGAGIGGFAPLTNRSAYDPDSGAMLSEQEERRAAAVHRELRAGDQENNIAMLGPQHNVSARPFGGQAPTFGYAADIDDMVREDPAMANLLMDKQSYGTSLLISPEGVQYKRYDVDDDVAVLGERRAANDQERRRARRGMMVGTVGNVGLGATLGSVLSKTPLKGMALGAAGGLGAAGLMAGASGMMLNRPVYRTDRDAGMTPSSVDSRVAELGLTPVKQSAPHQVNALTGPQGRNYEHIVFNDGSGAGLFETRERSNRARALTAGGLGALTGLAGMGVGALAGVSRLSPGKGAAIGGTLAGLAGAGLGASWKNDSHLEEISSDPTEISDAIADRGLYAKASAKTRGGTLAGVKSAWDKIKRDGKKPSNSKNSPHGHRREK